MCHDGCFTVFELISNLTDLKMVQPLLNPGTTIFKQGEKYEKTNDAFQSVVRPYGLLAK